MCEICLGQACHALRRRGQAWSQCPAALTGPSGPPGKCRIFGGAFATLGSSLRRVAPLMVQFPPFGGGVVAVRGGEVAVWGGVAPKVQTTSATNADNGQSWARSSALAAQRRLASRVARTFTPEM